MIIDSCFAEPPGDAAHPDAARLRQLLVRKFAITMATTSRLVTEFPELAADVAMAVAGPVLAEVEAKARADERERCIRFLRGKADGPQAEVAAADAAAFTAAAGLLAVRAAGLAVGAAGSSPPVNPAATNRVSTV